MKHFLKKIFLYGWILLGTVVCLQFVWIDVLWVLETYAQANTNTNEFTYFSDTQRDMASKLQLFVRVIYLLMRPLLAVAWATMDNNMVFGRAFFLETTLRNMRQIMRNFANFALWWLFLFAILRNVFVSMKGDEDTLNGTRWVKTLIPKLLIATILIQSSFFMMRALVDIAQAATYSIGTLPLTSIEQWDGIENIRFMKPLIQYSLDDTKAADGSDSTFSIFYTCNNAPKEQPYFIPCYFKNNTWAPDGDQNTAGTWEYHARNEAQSRAQLSGKETPGAVYNKINEDYCVYENSILARQTSWNVDVCQLAKLREDDKKAKWCDEENCTMVEMWCAPLSKFMDNAAGMTWPLYGLYASVLRMDQIALSPKNLDVVEMSIQFMVKLFIALALVLPLLALAVALVMRMVAIWWFVIFSPFLVLGRVFFKERISWFQDGKATFQTMISLIFMPVFVVFAISISLIFLTLIGRANELNVYGSDKWVGHNIGIQLEPWMVCDRSTWIISCPSGDECGKVNSRCYDLAGMTSLCFSEGQTSFGNTILNVMSYLLLNFFGIALMWMVVFAALKSNKITEKVVGGIESLGKDLAKNIPIIPTSKWGLSYNDVKARADGVKSGIASMWSNQAANLKDATDRFQRKRSKEKKQIQQEMGEATDANARQLVDRMESNTGIYDYDANGMNALSRAAWVAWATSLAGIASTRAGYDGLRRMSEGDNIENLTSKLDKTWDKSQHSQIVTELMTWLDTLATNSAETQIYKTEDGLYYDANSNNNELLRVTANEITRTKMPRNMSEIDDVSAVPDLVNQMIQEVKSPTSTIPIDVLPTWLQWVVNHTNMNTVAQGDKVIFNTNGAFVVWKTAPGEDEFSITYGAGGLIQSITKWKAPKKPKDNTSTTWS